MDKVRVFQALATKEPAVLLDLLHRAYEQLNEEQRQAVFGSYAGAASGPAVHDEPEGYEVDGERLLEAVEEFKTESLAGAYWAPFKVNSKNHRKTTVSTRCRCEMREITAHLVARLLNS